MAKNNYDPNYKLSNREKSQRAKRGKFWCDGCDACLVGQWGKCPNCGHKHNPKKRK